MLADGAALASAVTKRIAERKCRVEHARLVIRGDPGHISRLHTFTSHPWRGSHVLLSSWLRVLSLARIEDHRIVRIPLHRCTAWHDALHIWHHLGLTNHTLWRHLALITHAAPLHHHAGLHRLWDTVRHLLRLFHDILLRHRDLLRHLVFTCTHGRKTHTHGGCKEVGLSFSAPYFKTGVGVGCTHDVGRGQKETSVYVNDEQSKGRRRSSSSCGATTHGRMHISWHSILTGNRRRQEHRTITLTRQS